MPRNEHPTLWIIQPLFFGLFSACFLSSVNCQFFFFFFFFYWRKTSLVLKVAAKSLQSCPILCDPIEGSPPGSPVPGILQARTLEWVAISFSNAWKWKVKVKSLSRVQLFAVPWTAAYQAPPPMGFSRQEYWSGMPLPISSKIWGGVNLKKKRSINLGFLSSSPTLALIPLFVFFLSLPLSVCLNISLLWCRLLSIWEKKGSFYMSMTSWLSCFVLVSP